MGHDAIGWTAALSHIFPEVTGDNATRSLLRVSVGAKSEARRHVPSTWTSGGLTSSLAGVLSSRSASIDDMTLDNLLFSRFTKKNDFGKNSRHINQSLIHHGLQDTRTSICDLSLPFHIPMLCGIRVVKTRRSAVQIEVVA